MHKLLSHLLSWHSFSFTLTTTHFPYMWRHSVSTSLQLAWLHWEWLLTRQLNPAWSQECNWQQGAVCKRCQDMEFAGKCEHCVNNPLDVMCMFWILIHARSLIWSEQGKRFINGLNPMVAECSQFPMELEKLVPVARYCSFLYSVFSCEVLLYLYLWACFFVWDVNWNLFYKQGMLSMEVVYPQRQQGILNRVVLCSPA